MHTGLRLRSRMLKLLLGTLLCLTAWATLRETVQPAGMLGEAVGPI